MARLFQIPMSCPATDRILHMRKILVIILVCVTVVFAFACKSAKVAVTVDCTSHEDHLSYESLFYDRLKEHGLFSEAMFRGHIGFIFGLNVALILEGEKSYRLISYDYKIKKDTIIEVPMRFTNVDSVFNFVNHEIFTPCKGKYKPFKGYLIVYDPKYKHSIDYIIGDDMFEDKGCENQIRLFFKEFLRDLFWYKEGINIFGESELL